MGIASNIGVGAVIAILVVVGFIFLYNYRSGVMPGAKLVIAEQPSTQPSGLDTNQAKFLFFYTTWCPYSRKAETPWKSFQELLKNKPTKFGDTTIVFEEVNAEAQTAKAALYNIQSYPTFKVQTQDSVYEFVGTPTVSNFRDALSNTFGKETS